jgi:hypothetical protein
MDAATAKMQGLTVATSNISGFHAFGLEVFNPIVTAWPLGEAMLQLGYALNNVALTCLSYRR